MSTKELSDDLGTDGTTTDHEETPLYRRRDIYDRATTEGLADHVTDVLKMVGEDPEREGLLKTPERVAKAWQFLTHGYAKDPAAILESALFEEDYSEMILVKDIEIYSLCVPSKQFVNVVDGAKRASDVRVGDRLWTLNEGRVVPTTVESVTSRKVRELVEVETEKGTVEVTPDHPFATPEGWMEAKDLEGKRVEWTPPKKLCRERYEPEGGRDLGYAVGATCSDGTVADRYLSLVVNEQSFAERYAESWHRRHGFQKESHRTSLDESQWARVKRVTPRRATGKKPFTVYSFKCDPHPTFLIGGHLSHNCEHHMIPFFGKAHVAYIPDGRIVGLSKIPRVVDVFARRLQVQERLTLQIRDAIDEVLQPQGVAVVIEAQHLCMMMRGAEKQNSTTTTSAMSGQLMDPTTRAEFMRLIHATQ